MKGSKYILFKGLSSDLHGQGRTLSSTIASARRDDATGRAQADAAVAAGLQGLRADQSSLLQVRVKQEKVSRDTESKKETSFLGL